MKNLSYTYRDIFKIALPLMVSNFFYTLIAITDVGFMKEVGVAEQAAIGYISLLYLIMFMIGFSYTKGTQILIAQKEGQGKIHAIGKIVDNTFIVLASAAIFLFLLIVLFSYSFLDTIIADKAVFEASYQFLKIRKWGFFLSFLGSLMVAYYSGIGRTAVLAVAIIVMSLTNIFLNWVLIFGHLGFEPMGIEGAAWASNIAEGLSFTIMMLGVFLFRLHKLHDLFQFKKISLKIIGKISELSSPLVVQTLVGLGAWFVFFTLVEKMGPDELAVSNVVKQVYTLLGIPTFALASTTNTVIGNVVGRKRINEVIPLMKRMILVSSGCIFLFSLPTFIYPYFLMNLLTEPSLLQETYKPLVIALVALQIYGFSTVIFNTIASIGSTMVSMIIEIITIVVYLIYLYLLFYVWDSSLEVVWTSEWWYWGCIAVLSVLFLKFSNWRKKLEQSLKAKSSS